jgi:hypothetical protein
MTDTATPATPVEYREYQWAVEALAYVLGRSRWDNPASEARVILARLNAAGWDLTRKDVK